MDFKSFLEYTGHLKPNTAKYSAAHKSSHKNPMKHAIYHDDGKGTSSSVKGGFEHEHEAQAHIKSLKAKGDKRNLVVKRTYMNEDVSIDESVKKVENLITHTMNYDHDSIIKHVTRNKTTYDKKTHDHVAKIKHHLSKGDTDKANDHVDDLNNHLHKKHKIERHIHESMANQIRDAEMYMPALKCLEFAKESLKEEEKAVKDYEDRIKNCKDKRLVKILKHLVEEEKHHVKMLKDYIQQVTK